MRWCPLVLCLAACTRPPVAPDGLDESLRFLLRSFYGTDEQISSGLSGLVSWVDAEGEALLDTRANLDNVGAFSLAPLSLADVGALRPRPSADPGEATGVVAVAELPCAWRQAEDLLVRPDQAEVFPDFDYCVRTYVNSRSAFESARSDGFFEAIDTPLRSDERALVPSNILLTENRAAVTDLGVTIEFDVDMHARHGRFDVLGEPTLASLFLTWMPHRAAADGGVNSIEQSYTIELDIQRGGQTLWIYGSWAELHTSVFDSDSAALMALAVNSAQGTAERMADICEGKVVLED